MRNTVEKISVKDELVRQLYRHSPHVYVSFYVLLLFALIAFWGVMPRAFFLPWLLVNLSINTLFLINSLHFHLAEKSAKPCATTWLRRYTALTFMQGLAWGTIGPVSIQLENSLYMMLTLFMLGGMCAGAIATRAIVFKAYLAAQIPLLTPVLLMLLIQGTPMSLVIAALIGIFFVFMLSVARSYSRSNYRTIQLWADNEQLVDTLQVSKAELEQANRLLQQEIEQRREAQEQLIEAKREAVQANEAKNRFLATMSHEIRTPLNGIIGFSDILQKSRLPAEQQDYIHTIGRSARSLLAIVSDILDISRIESSKIVLSRHDIDLRAALDEVIGVMTPLAQMKNICLYRDIDIPVPHWIRGDEYRLKQIFTNILGNAIKFTSAGFVSLTVSVDQHADASRVLFIIEDSGIGISPGKQDVIFEPFRQLEAFDTRRHEGTGLGLAIAKSFINLMGGDISLSSMKGIGTTVRVEIPYELASPGVQGVARFDTLQGMLALGNQRMESAMRHLLAYFSVAIVEHEAQADFIVTDAVSLQETFHSHTGCPLLLLHEDSGAEERAEAGEGIYHLPVNVSHRLMEETLEALLTGSRERELGGDVVSNDDELVTAKVLLVDDNPINLKVLSSFLQRNGIFFDTAEGGSEALHLLGRNAYDIILLDIQMPEISGFDVLQTLNASQQPHPPVIAVTAHAFPEQRRAILESGFVDCLTKPVSESELLAALREHLLPVPRGRQRRA